MKARFLLPLICVTALAGCAAENAPVIPNREEQFAALSDVYSAFGANGGKLSEDFGGWNYGGDGYLHVMVTCGDTSAYEFLNENGKRVVFEPAEYSIAQLEELAENFTLTVGDITLEGGSADIHTNKVYVYVDEDVYSDSETMAELYKAAVDLPVEFVTPLELTV